METKESVFDKKTLKEIYEEIRMVYLSDDRPWVIGFSGGKDSTAALQLLWYAISEIPKRKRTKMIHIITSDTLVESPALLKHVADIHKKINNSAKKQKLPFIAEQIKPKVSETFWVNVIGKGYPSPTKMFRWCTDRLKIKPADKFILEKVSKYGEVILILGVRKAESVTRAQVMNLYKIKNSLLSRHSKFPQTYVYTPVEDFNVDDIWSYLLQTKSPWGGNNRELLALYSSKDSGECPLVIDRTTPSCGGSRFGCWTCTVVSKDKAMDNLIADGQTWLKPLAEIRALLYKTTFPENKEKYRDFKSKKGFVRLKSNGSGEISRGPYKLSFCKELLELLLESQKRMDKENPKSGFKILTEEEIHEIRRLWLLERADWEDSVPKIYKKMTGKDLNWVVDDSGSFSLEENRILNSVCKKYSIPSEFVIKLLDIERQMQGMTRRSSVYSKIDNIVKREWRSEKEFLKDLAIENDFK